MGNWSNANTGSSDSVAEQIETDVVVVGGGAAGLAAAVAASEHGAKVVVIEKRRVFGGNGVHAEGVFAAESPVQRRHGIDVTRDEMFALAMDYAHQSLNAGVLRAFVDKSGDTVRWLEEKGLSFDSLRVFTPKQSHRVFHSPEGRGRAIIEALLDECKVRGVRILCDAAADQLIVDGSGRATGVAVSLHGTKLEVRAPSVVVATGGFAGNRELLREYCDFYTEDYSCPGIAHMGDGLAMMRGVGAATEGLGRLQRSGPNFPGGVFPLIELVRQPLPIWVNRRGERFTAEGMCCNDFEAINAILRQPDKRCYVLLDQALVDSMTENGNVWSYRDASLQPGGGVPVPSLRYDLQMAAEGLSPVAQVKPDACNGCAICVDTCPETAIRLDTSYEDGNEISPCSAACPAGVNVRAYVYLLRNGRVDEADAQLREFLPLPAVTGRVCPRPCESECARNNVDQPVNINALEQFVADNGRGKGVPEAKRRGGKVAVIGSGPAGLSCAYFLSRLGYPVSIFEREAVPGGMLRMGIPEHRLPRDVLDGEIGYIKDMGVEFHLNVVVGRDISLETLEEEFEAIFFAGGAQSSRKIDIEGTHLRGVEWGIEFLRKVNLGLHSEPGQNMDSAAKVVVIGGGNVAVDAALVALRLGAKEVSMVCLERGPEIPAFDEELAQAAAEGVIIQEGWGPKRIMDDGGKVAGIEIVRCTAVTDERGCFNPTFDETASQTLDADRIILAVGQDVTASLVPDATIIEANGVVATRKGTSETKRKGLFAGGAATGGINSVVEAIADGRRAAESIDRYLSRDDLDDSLIPDATAMMSVPAPNPMKNPPGEKIWSIPRVEAPERRSPARRGFSELMAKQESERCMTCGSRPIVDAATCKCCRSCEQNCPTAAISAEALKRDLPLVKIADNLEEIALWMGADPAVLRATVERYNGSCDSGEDPVFAKDSAYLNALRTPPYYALKCNMVILTTTGGVRINERMEVLGAEDDPIPGLYAAGNDTGGWESDTYNVLLPGSTFGFAVNSGRIAGESAARHSRVAEMTGK